MHVRTERESGRRLADTARTLLSQEPYLAYANFQAMARRDGAVTKLHLERWKEAADGLGVLVARDEEDTPLAMLRMAHRAFESEHFGLRIAQMEAPAGVADEGVRLPALRALYDAACVQLREAGYEHLTALASAQDRIACWTLQESGAFHVGTRISWMQPLTGQPSDHDLPAPLRIELYEKADIAKLSPAYWQRLLTWTRDGFDRGPFVFDLNVPRDRSTGLYGVWTEKALSGEWADVLLVVRDGDEVVSFHSMLLLPDMSEAAGVGIVGRGIGATLPGYRGLFTALQKECAAVRPLGAGFLENETQTATIQSIQVFGKLGHQCLRSTASFHMRLSGGRESGAGGRQSA
jgi:hypothetical protein